jgi:phosphinothricin acetyltransferase
MQVRAATESDLFPVLDIVNREIREGVAHFATREHTPDDARAWLRSADRLPFLVATDAQGRVAGYARASRWKDREAYDWATEIGVYVRPDTQGRGVGRALYAELIPRLITLGYRSIIAGIALPNPASVRLHEAMGMSHVGTFPAVGYKHGQWIDVGYWVLAVGDGPPAAISSTSG